jgi:hypothetical protein
MHELICEDHTTKMPDNLPIVGPQQELLGWFNHSRWRGMVNRVITTIPCSIMVVVMVIGETSAVSWQLFNAIRFVVI